MQYYDLRTVDQFYKCARDTADSINKPGDIGVSNRFTQLNQTFCGKYLLREDLRYYAMTGKLKNY